MLHESVYVCCASHGLRLRVCAALTSRAAAGRMGQTSESIVVIELAPLSGRAWRTVALVDAAGVRM
jgi:hypothetical protein